MHRTHLADLERGKRNAALSNIAVTSESLDLNLTEFFRLMERTRLPSTQKR